MKAEKEVTDKRNNELNAKIKEINGDLKSRQTMIDSLYAEVTKHQSQKAGYDKLCAQWRSAKEIYGSKVLELKSQINKANKMIPLEKYESVVGEAAKVAKSVQDKDSQINKLSQQVSQLESLLRSEPRNDESTFSKSSLTSGQTLYHSKEVKHASSVSTTRRETLKAAGGRAALNEKLKKTRGSLMKSQQLKSNGNGLKRTALQPISNNKQNQGEWGLSHS